ncbi:MAG: 50S ribosomal protein L4 [Planctomycetaceae bacterium]|nr:50S ribosomal protein L4 [Planctomycetaceae bacterium]
MASFKVHNVSGAEVGSYDFDPAELAESINKQLLHDVVVMYEANKRVGTVRTKARGEVAGSTKKLYRQKGTGRARAGARRTPVRRGGGHTFAKRPRDFSYRLPRKAVRSATRMALRSKFDDSQVVILDSLAVSEVKTKPVADMVKAVGLAGKSVLLAIPEYQKELWLSARNICGLQVSPVFELNAYDLLHQHHLIITKDALDRFREGKPPVEDAEEKEAVA